MDSLQVEINQHQASLIPPEDRKGATATAAQSIRSNVPDQHRRVAPQQGATLLNTFFQYYGSQDMVRQLTLAKVTITLRGIGANDHTRAVTDYLRSLHDYTAPVDQKDTFAPRESVNEYQLETAYDSRLQQQGFSSATSRMPLRNPEGELQRDAEGNVRANQDQHLSSKGINGRGLALQPFVDDKGVVQQGYWTESGATTDSRIMEMDNANPLNTIDALTTQFSDNWFDSNTSLHGERYLLITSAWELALMNYFISQGTGTETAFEMLRNGKAGVGEFEKGQAAGYIGTIRGGWKLIKIHPEFLPKVFVDASLVVDPLGYTGKGGVTLKQVAALACYSQSAQTFDYFSKRRSEDGGTRFDGTEYVQDFSYDAWVIEQRSEGIVPLFIPATPGIYQKTLDSFNFVAAEVAAARAQLSVAPSTYPLSGPETLLSTPEWFHGDYTSTTNLDASLDVQEAGDMSHRNPIVGDDNPFDAEEVEDLQAQVGGLQQEIIDGATVYSDADALALGENVKVGDKVFNVTDAGTTVAGDDDLWDAIEVGETSPFGTAGTAGVVERIV